MELLPDSSKPGGGGGTAATGPATGDQWGPVTVSPVGTSDGGKMELKLCP